MPPAISSSPFSATLLYPRESWQTLACSAIPSATLGVTTLAPVLQPNHILLRIRQTLSKPPKGLPSNSDQVLKTVVSVVLISGLFIILLAITMTVYILNRRLARKARLSPSSPSASIGSSAMQYRLTLGADFRRGLHFTATIPPSKGALFWCDETVAGTAMTGYKGAIKAGMGVQKRLTGPELQLSIPAFEVEDKNIKDNMIPVLQNYPMDSAVPRVVSPIDHDQLGHAGRMSVMTDDSGSRYSRATFSDAGSVYTYATTMRTEEVKSPVKSGE